MEYGHWKHPHEFDPAEWFGFIYRIIDLDNGREYIGKKQFHSHTKKKVKTKAGGTRNKRVVKESNWRDYTSSSTHVNAAITERGKDRFVFLIEALYKSKALLHYAEVEFQILEDVLRAKLPEGDRKYYNGMIGNIKFIPPSVSEEEAKHRVTDEYRMIERNKKGR